MRWKELAIVALAMLVVAGGLIAHLIIPSPYSAAQHRAIESNVSGSMVPNSIKAVETRTIGTYRFWSNNDPVSF